MSTLSLNRCSTFTLYSAHRPPWNRPFSCLWLISLPSTISWSQSWSNRYRILSIYLRIGSFRKNNATNFTWLALRHSNTPKIAKVLSRSTWMQSSLLIWAEKTRKKSIKQRSSMLRDWSSQLSKVHKLSTSKKFFSSMPSSCTPSKANHFFSSLTSFYKKTLSNLRRKLQNRASFLKRKRSVQKKLFWRSSTFKFVALREIRIRREKRPSSKLLSCSILMKTILRNGSSKLWAMGSSMPKLTSSTIKSSSKLPQSGKLTRMSGSRSRKRSVFGSNASLLSRTSLILKSQVLKSLKRMTNDRKKYIGWFAL